MKKVYVILAVLLAGCSVDGYVVDKAAAVCAARNGVATLIRDLKADHVRCNDGTIYQYIDRGEVINTAK